MSIFDTFFDFFHSSFLFLHFHTFIQSLQKTLRFILHNLHRFFINFWLKSSFLLFLPLTFQLLTLHVLSLSIQKLLLTLKKLLKISHRTILYIPRPVYFKNIYKPIIYIIIYIIIIIYLFLVGRRGVNLLNYLLIVLCI